MKSRGDGRIFRRKGSAFWWAAYYLRGKEYRESTGETEENKAQKFLGRKLKEVHADQIGAKPFVGPQQERIKVSDLLNALEADYRLRGKESPQFKAHLRSVRDYFGDWRAVEVTAEAVDQFISELLAGDPDGSASEKRPKAPATVNRSTQLLRQAYELAIKRRRLSNAPFIRHLSEKGNTRIGFFDEGQFRQVLRHLPEYLQDFCLFGYKAGWRKGEIAVLGWDDVEDDTIRLRGEDSKNGEPRMIVIEGELVEVMERRKAARQVARATGDVMLADLVFHHLGQPVGDFRKAWQTACVAAGVGKFVCRHCGQPAKGRKCEFCGTGEVKYIGRIFHDFRRTSVRNMVRAGVPERVAMSVSGHKTRSIFDRYNIVSEDDLRSAMQRTQDYLKDHRTREQPTVITKVAAKK